MLICDPWIWWYFKKNHVTVNTYIINCHAFYVRCTTVYPKKYVHGFVVLCFVVVMQSFIMNSHEVFIHIHQGCFAGTGAIVRLPQCQWSKPDGYGKISQCITTTKHSKAKTVCIFLGIYCILVVYTNEAKYLSLVMYHYFSKQQIIVLHSHGWLGNVQIQLKMLAI